jgi:hypothetical protein
MREGEMRKLIGAVFLAFMLALGNVGEAKELVLSPTNRVEVPETCPNFKEYEPFPAQVIAINQELQMAAVAQEGQKDDQFVLLFFVIQHNDSTPADLFLLFVQHSDMKDPSKPITVIYADKGWIEKGVPSGRLVVVKELPKNVEFYKDTVSKRFVPGKGI